MRPRSCGESPSQVDPADDPEKIGQDNVPGLRRILDVNGMNDIPSQERD